MDPSPGNMGGEWNIRQLTNPNILDLMYYMYR